MPHLLGRCSSCGVFQHRAQRDAKNKNRMADVKERSTVQEKAEIALLHASALIQRHTAEELNRRHPSRPRPGQRSGCRNYSRL